MPPPIARDLHGPPPTRLGDFEIARELGRGSMGVVYDAIQISLGRRVALKVFSTHGKSPQQIERFRREAQAAAKLVHPGIVPVLAVGEDKQFHYYAMQLVEGKTLRELIYKDRVPRERAVMVAERIAEALDHAHRQGVIHRDVKPSNVIVTARDEPLIADFGLAKDTSLAGMTVAGVVLGTPTHMSPEQALGSGRVDHRTDIYALGVCLYEMLTCRLPFYGENLEEVLEKIAAEDPPRPRSIDRSIPRPLEAIVLQCLAKNPDERYATAADLAQDLDRFLRGEKVHARRPSLLRPLFAWAGRHRAAAAFLALLLAGGAATGAFFAARTVAVRAERAQLIEDLERARAERDEGAALAAATRLLAIDPGNEAAQNAWLELAIARDRAEAEERKRRNSAEAEKHVAAGDAAVARAREMGAAAAGGEAEAREAERAYDEALDHYGRALGLDPESVPARGGRGRIYLRRAIAAERHGDDDLAAAFFALVRDHNPDGLFDRQLRPEGAIEVKASAPGARVALFRVHETDEGGTRREPVGDGPAPLSRDALAVGSYLVEVTADGFAPALVPIAIERDVREALDVRLLRPGDIPPGFAYVPAGPVRIGGDRLAIRSLPGGRRRVEGFFLSLRETTCAEYTAFLNDLPEHDAAALAPRGGPRQKYAQIFWRDDETRRWVFPRMWPPDRPVTGVTYEAAVRFAAWRAAKEKRPYRLPAEVEWEKAARGADGRAYPWGEAPPEGRANVALGAEPGQAKPAGGTAGDVSMHGVLDLIGNASEWTSSDLDRRGLHRIVRGGSYMPSADLPRAAARFPTEIANPPEHTGFRLACDLPE